jgi:hypothetical protein
VFARESLVGVEGLGDKTSRSISSSSKHQNIKTSTNHNSDMTSYNEKRAGGRIGAT